MNGSQKPIFIGISAMTIVKIILVFIVFYLLYLVRDILAVVFISVVLASAFDPSVDWMQKRKIPRAMGILLIYLIAFLVSTAAISLIVPPIVEQTTDLINKFPQVSQYVSTGYNLLKEYSQQGNLFEKLLASKENFPQFVSTFESIFSGVSGFLGGIVNFFLILVLTFYITVEENAIKKLVWTVVPEKHQIYTMNLVNRMQSKIGLWLRGQLILSVVIFTLVYAALSVLGVKYALILALIAGLTEFVPYLGPTLAAVPGIFLAFSQSGIMLAIFVGIVYYLVQLTENNIIAPKVMQKVVGLNPIVSITVLMIGFKLAGVAGAILSIPVATAISVFFKDVVDSKAAGEGKGEVSEQMNDQI